MNQRTINVRFPTANVAPNKTTFVVGQTGTGKTTLLANLLQDESRSVVFDTEGNFLESGGEVARNQNEFAKLLNLGTRRIVYASGAESAESDFESMSNILFQFQGANPQLGECALCVDETARIAGANSYPDALAHIVQRGRAFHIVKYFGCQWFTRIPAFMRDSFSDMYVFRQIDKVALKALETFGFDAETIQSLPDLNCVLLSRGEFTRLTLNPCGVFRAQSAKKNYFSVLAEREQIK